MTENMPEPGPIESRVEEVLEDTGILVPDFVGEVEQLPNPTPAEAEASQLGSPDGV